jgi:GTP-binding protein HflX
VGFIRQLPHDLVAAFRATLEETREADLLLHVVDANDPQRREHIAQVNQVLQEIGAGEVPQLMAYNKCDLLDESPHVDRDSDGKPWRVWLSALQGDGTDLVLAALAERLSAETVEGWLCLSASGARLRAELFECGSVCEEFADEQGRWWLRVHIPQQELTRRCAANGVNCELHPDPQGEVLASVAQGP